MMNAEDQRQQGTQDCEPIKIRNRDIFVLQDVIRVMQEVRALETRRQWQRERMTNITRHLTGMPIQHGGMGGLDAAFAALAQLEDDHKEKVKEYICKLKAAEQIVNGIGNPFMRTFVTMMYIENLSAKMVRSELNLSEWGFKRARQAVEQAEDMGRVVWRVRYILVQGNNITQSV